MTPGSSATGNTVMVYFYQEFTAGLESITWRVCVTGSPSVRGQIVETSLHRCTYRNHNIHTCAHACLSSHLGRVCVWTVRSRAVWDTWQAAGNGRGRCIKTCEAKLEKERKKYCGAKIRRQEKEKQNILLRKVQTIRHSWWHPQRSISCSDPGTTWKLISFVSSGKQSQQTCPTPETHAGTHTNSNLCLSQSGTKGNEISKVSITACHTSAEMTAPGQIRLGNTRVTLT